MPNQFLRRLSKSAHVLRLVWDIAPGWTAAVIALAAMQGLIPAALLLVARRGAMRLVGLITASPGDIPAEAVLLAAGIGGILLTSQLLASVGTWIREEHGELVKGGLMEIVHEKLLALDLALLDTPSFQDTLFQATTEATTRPLAFLQGMATLVQNLMSLGALCVVLARFGLGLAAAIVLTAVPAAAAAVYHQAARRRTERETRKDQRLLSYLNWNLVSRDSGAELRMFHDMASMLFGRYKATRDKLREIQRSLHKRHAAAELSVAAGTLALVGGVGFWWVRGEGSRMPLADLLIAAQSAYFGLTLARATVEGLGLVYANSLFIEDLSEFLSQQPTVLDPPDPLSIPAAAARAVTVKNVAFRYPGADPELTEPVLRAVSMEIRPGKVTAVVGPNGAGKTTLLKLLCRLYDPTEGSLELDGIDYRRFRRDDLRAQFAPIFQQPLRIQGTVSQNVAVTDSADPARLEAACRAAFADAFVAKLPRGYDHPLGPLFERSSDLSGGQWQRLGLARALYQARPILLLDEPTSAMDPWTEAEWVRKLPELAAGRTVLLITHRFAAVQAADYLYVLEDGSIVESGSPSELVRSGGRYAQAYSALVSNESGGSQSPGARPM